MGPLISPGADRRDDGYSAVRSPLAMDDVTFRGLGHRLVDTMAAYLDMLPKEAVYRPMPVTVRQELETMKLPADGVAPEDVIDTFLRLVLPYGRGQNHPRFAAFVDPAASKLSMLAAFVSAVTNTSGAGGNYAAIYMERTAIRWLMELIGFPVDGSDGVLLGGGSDANRHCLEVARYWGAQANGWDVRNEGLHGHPRLTMYMSAEGHSCLEKAAFTLGLGAPRKVMVGEDFRMDLADLRDKVAADRRAGHLPFLVAANAGSVKTGAIDPLGDLAEFCRQEDLWLHVDGAYGGFGVLDSRLAHWYAGLELADSVALDPHKWLAVAIGCSCAMVRQGALLQDTYKLIPSYLSLRPGHGFNGDVWYSHRCAEQTRDSGRAVKTFWNIQQAGKAGLVDHVRRHIDLARYLEDVIEASPDLELLASGPLTAVCFRYVPEGSRGDDQSLNELNQAITEDLQVDGRAFMAGTDIRGRYAIRSCALHYELDEGHMQAIVNAVRDAGQHRVRTGSGRPPRDQVTEPTPPRAGGRGRPVRAVASSSHGGSVGGEQHVPLSEHARLALALSAGKAAGTACRVLRFGGGTSFPGSVAHRIDPRLLQKVVAATDAREIVVTGSNGKTTTCRMLAALARARGLRVIQNRSGSNLLRGVISAAVREADLRGRVDAQLLVLEVDEAFVRLVTPEMKPEALLITNIFRDQLDRFGEVYSIARGLEAGIEALPASATVVLNGDDPLVASIAPDAPTSRMYFGIRADDSATHVPEHAADSIRCMRCQHLLRYRAVHLSHLGDYECPECGNARPELDVAVTKMLPSPDGGSEIIVDTPAGTFLLQVPLPGIHNVYNAAAALAGIIASLERPPQPDEARRAISALRPAFGRLEEIRAGDRQVVLAFVKNPTAYNTTLREVLRRPGRKNVLAAHSNTPVDGEDFAWLWDVDLEQLAPQLASLVVSGTRAEEVALRFRYAGANAADMRVLHSRSAALRTALVRTPPGESLYIFAGYTPMRELRGIMQRRGWVAAPWKE